MPLIDPSEWHLEDALLPINSRYWTCSNPACLLTYSGELDGPEHCPLCGTEAQPGTAGKPVVSFSPEGGDGRWWECPAGCRPWFGSLSEQERCPDCHAPARPSHFEGYTPEEP
jgi:hypothetical protein